jgi:hypothetical protein
MGIAMDNKFVSGVEVTIMNEPRTNCSIVFPPSLVSLSPRQTNVPVPTHWELQ